MSKIDLESYNTVPERITEFKTKYPEGSLQQVRYELLEVAGKVYLAFTAAAYRHPDDKLPGIGTAWEPVPGATTFTRDSEMQNAETSAWGRAIVAALAADTRKGIASREEVENRQTEQSPLAAAKVDLWQLLKRNGIAPVEAIERFAARNNGDELKSTQDLDAVNEMIQHYAKIGGAEQEPLL